MEDSGLTQEQLFEKQQALFAASRARLEEAGSGGAGGSGEAAAGAGAITGEGEAGPSGTAS